MSDQAIDVRAAVSLLRRHRLLIAVAALIGASAGVGLGIVRPPMYVSTSEVLLPQLQANDPATQIDSDTQKLIASSAAVLGPAGRGVHPTLPYKDVVKRVTVTAPSVQTIVFRAAAPTPARAQALADAAAHSEVSYVAASELAQSQSQQAKALSKLAGSLAKMEGELQHTRSNDASMAALSGQVAAASGQLNALREQGIPGAARATILQSASPAERSGPVKRYILPGAIGLLTAVALACAVLIITRKKDRRLRSRDAIADAVGRSVLASLTCPKPRAVAGWMHFFDSYQPSTADSWALRQVLRQLEGSGTRRVTVVSLGNDAGGLAVGPLLATYAASGGVRVRLVAAQRDDAAAALWGACRQGMSEPRNGLELSADPRDADLGDVDLTVVVVVLDRNDTRLAVPAGPTLIAVSAGAATVDDLARTAVAADDAGGDIVGLVIADADENDRTTGRMLAGEHPEQSRTRPARIAAVPRGEMRRRMS